MQEFTGRDARFPILIAIVCLDEAFYRRKSVMFHFAAQPAGRAIHNHVLVHFVVAIFRRRVC